MTNQIVVTAPTGVQVVHTSSHTVLLDEEKPVLGGHLNAQGKDIMGAGNIEVKTINGEDWGEKFSSFFADMKDHIKAFANKEHTHPEFAELKKHIEQQIADNTPPPAASPDHTHTFDTVVGVLPLNRVGNSKEIQEFMKRDLADRKHDHPELATKIGAIANDLEATKKSIINPAVVDNLSIRIKKIEDTLAMPKITVPTPPTEIVVKVNGEEQILLPKKCDGLALQEVAARTSDSQIIQVTVKCNDQVLEIPSRVSADTILTLISDKPCLCRLLFR
jgi:hypothetical protein